MDNNLKTLLNCFYILAIIIILMFVMKAYSLAGVSVYEFTVKDSEAQIKLLQELLKEKEEKPKQVVKKPLLTPKKVETVYVKAIQDCPNDKNCIAGDINKNTDKDVARQIRLSICQEVYEKLKDKVINHKNVVERCATMMTLQYAYESGHGKSSRCTKGNNCFGIKHNKRDRCIKNSDGFCTFKSQKEGSYDYAEMFYKHYEGYKTVGAYLNAYSPDGNKSYHLFVKTRYDNVLKYFLNN